LGVVPWLADLALPEEDSLGLSNMVADQTGKMAETLDVAVVVPQRVSNFNDLDPLAAEPDVRLRLVTNALELGAPDAVILPGSKNTIEDMRALRGAGFAAALRSLPEHTRIVGVCAGLQMLGHRVEDPLGLESLLGPDQRSVEGFGLLPLVTELKPEKTLTRVSLRDPRTGHDIAGYEIHHGETALESGCGATVLFATSEGRALAWGLDDAERAAGGLPRVWGTYLHGVFDADGFRRAFIDDLRRTRGLAPLGVPQIHFGLEPALNQLAAALRRHLDMKRLYAALGLGKGGLLG